MTRVKLTLVRLFPRLFRAPVMVDVERRLFLDRDPWMLRDLQALSDGRRDLGVDRVIEASAQNLEQIAQLQRVEVGRLDRSS